MMAPYDLPDLTSEYPVTEAQAQQYKSEGHFLAREVCTANEIGLLRPVINEAAYRYNTQTAPIEERDTYGKAFLQIMNLWVKDQRVRKFVLAKRFARIAADLMGVDGVRLYHDQALYKEPGGGHTPWHQDQFYWPLDTSSTITMWMPLVDVSIEMGPITFASGSQREGFLGHLAISDESHEAWDQVVAEQRYPVVNAAMKAGDATFHSGWTLHRAPGNTTSRTREVMTIIYFADGARALTPDNPARANDLANWLPGVKPGEPAASELNPLLFSR
ncbi:MAG TPA: phytanoyl-CoA dioxygenase family protein [Chthonomonadales bacterium]|nr:phytanoyl-CoA dioxygenase family protein [Chthonomonadales bacterium]